MPLYEYRCDACSKTFEARQKFSDAPLSECRFCGGPVQKQISQTGFALKGGGWYNEGYSSGKPAPACSGGSQGGCGGCPQASNS